MSHGTELRRVREKEEEEENNRKKNRKQEKKIEQSNEVTEVKGPYGTC